MTTPNIALSDADAELLVEAVVRARGPLSCRYVEAGEPQCVIGQFQVLRGLDPKLLEWQGQQSVWHVLRSSGDSPAATASFYSLRDIPEDLLVTLQSIWDGAPYRSVWFDGMTRNDHCLSKSSIPEDDRRMAMLFVIEAYRQGISPKQPTIYLDGGEET